MDAEIFELHIKAGEKCGAEKTCGKKTRYETEDTAQVAAEHHNRWSSRRHDVEPYPCAFCGQWHLGNIMPVSLLKEIAEA